MYVFSGVAVLASAACSDDLSGPSTPRPKLNREAKFIRRSVSYDTIPNAYIIQLTDDSTATRTRTAEVTDRLLRQYGGRETYRYDVAIHGYAIENMSADAAVRLAKDPAVKLVEPDMREYAATTQNNPGNGLDRIDQVSLPVNFTFTYTYSGYGVHAYIIDTGINSNHYDVTGRVGFGKTCVGGTPETDTDGHGTAMASIVGGNLAGVAKNVTLHSVRVSTNGSFSSSAATCGINWVASYAITPAVVNYSFSTVPSTNAVQTAIGNVTGQGIVFVKAAGNDGVDAFLDRGNRATDALIVGAINPLNDTYLSFSNWGSTVTLHAPGEGVQCADALANGTIYYELCGGTSASAALVSGVVAAMLEKYPTASQSFLRGTLLGNATLGGLSGLPSGSPNVLLYSNFL
jgi:subtilisin family serine protease